LLLKQKLTEEVAEVEAALQKKLQLLKKSERKTEA
jgi:hypothetical protein